MHRSTVCRNLSFVALSLFVVLALPVSAHAARPTIQWGSAERLMGADLVTKLWGWISSIWAEEGGGLDPNGKPIPPTPQRPEGSDLDPDGLHRNEGSDLDPNGI